MENQRIFQREKTTQSQLLIKCIEQYMEFALTKEKQQK